jgi:hypothetical protein
LSTRGEGREDAGEIGGVSPKPRNFWKRVDSMAYD